jgi:hypothetical protein
MIIFGVKRRQRNEEFGSARIYDRSSQKRRQEGIEEGRRAQ